MVKKTCSGKIEALMKKRDKARFQEFNRCKTDKCRKLKDKKADRMDRQITKLDKRCID